MKQPNTIPMAIEQLKQTATFYFSKLQPLNHQPVIKVGGNYDSKDIDNSDLHLEIAGWICITPFHAQEETKGIAGKFIKDAIHYSIQKVIVISGNRDEPDDVDIVDVKLFKPLTCPMLAIEFVCMMMLRLELNNIGELFCINAEIEESENESFA